MEDTLPTQIISILHLHYSKELVNNGFGAVGTMDPTHRESPDVLKDQKRKYEVQHIRGDMECGLEMELLFIPCVKIQKLYVWHLQSLREFAQSSQETIQDINRCC